MPLHDWSSTRGWSGVHLYWIVGIADYLRDRLPAGYRAYIGTSPVVAIDDPPGEPDVQVRREPPAPLPEVDDSDPFQPDREVLVSILQEEDRSVYVESADGRLVAAVELVSPKNKHGDAQRARSLARYLGYLTNHVHLLAIDPHPRPRLRSLADAIAARLGLPDEPPLPAPFVISYRVNPGEAGEGSRIAVRRRPLTIGSPLPEMPVALNPAQAVMIDLEGTYMQAARRAYLA